MAAERLREWREHRAQKPYVLALPGASTTDGAAIAMNSVWGPTVKDALVPRSILNQEFKKEPPDKDRYKKLVSVAKTQIENGRKLTIDTGSLGSAELCFLMDEMIDQMGQDWLRQHKDQIHIILTSPTAPKNKRESLKYLGKYLGPVALQEAGAIPFVLPLPRKTRFLRSAQQFASLPPEDFTEHAATYSDGLSRAGKKLSQASQLIGEVKEVSFEPDPERNFLAKENIFSSERREQINELDKKLLTAMQEGNDKVARRLLKRRAKLTQSEFNNIYSGKYAEEMGDTPRDIPPVERTKEGKRLRRKVLQDTFWKTNIFDRIATIADTGIQMTVVVPEFDVLFTVERALELTEGRDNVSVVLARSRTHGFPPGSHPEIAIPIFERSKAA